MNNIPQKILDSKRALRRELASLPVGEKLRMLEAMRERAVSISGHRRSEPECGPLDS